VPYALAVLEEEKSNEFINEVEDKVVNDYM